MHLNEDDDLDFNDQEADEGTSSGPAAGRKNYITPDGLAKLRAEYSKLFHDERPKLVETIAWAASNGDRSENADYIYGKRRLREIDRRLKFLGRRLENSEVVEPGTQNPKMVLFGARVFIEDENGKRMDYHIVGEDEIDIDKRKISWVSLVAIVFFNKTVGDQAVIHRPSGEIEVTILKIEYPKH
jgi:transcription elongation factor GreB